MNLAPYILAFTLPLMTGTAGAETEKPRVLFLVDDIYYPACNQAKRELQKQVDIEVTGVSAKQAYTTETALRNLDQWLGGEAWDLIVFNVGLTDMAYRAPNMKSFRIMAKNAGGVRPVTPEIYGNNLAKLTARIQETGAKVVWVNNLPIQTSLLDVHEPGSEVSYNQAAEEVMSSSRIPTIDLHSHALSLLTPKEKKQGSVKLKVFSKKDIHGPMVAKIREVLNLGAAKQHQTQ